MKLSLVSLIFSAGLAISQASAAPLRIVVVSGPVSNTNGFIRVGHAATNPPHSNFNVATMHSVNKMHTKSKHGCAGSFRAKAIQISNWIRQGLGLPPVNNEVKAVVMSDGNAHILPVGGPNGGPNYHHHQTNIHHSAHAQSFVQRLTRAIMMLGPWEGRAVSFVLGCGIGVLIRMFWVLAVVLIRSARSKKREEEFLGDEIIFEGEEHLLPPPQYVVVENDVKEKNVLA